ncbi:hypothetical protein MMC25_004833 [Agyrium rufum]|nr:hypothetical protein [Agyrium rufum]
MEHQIDFHARLQTIEGSIPEVYVEDSQAGKKRTGLLDVPAEIRCIIFQFALHDEPACFKSINSVHPRFGPELETACKAENKWMAILFPDSSWLNMGIDRRMTSIKNIDEIASLMLPSDLGWESTNLRATHHVCKALVRMAQLASNEPYVERGHILESNAAREILYACAANRKSGHPQFDPIFIELVVRLKPRLIAAGVWPRSDFKLCCMWRVRGEMPSFCDWDRSRERGVLFGTV